MLLHMQNIRGGFLRAVNSKLAGTIITSWSYRGSPHEVCLPEYACAAYGWSIREADVAALLARFFRERYGLPEADGAALARIALEETKLIVPTALGRPTLDTKERAWTIPAARQADQLIARMREEDPARLKESLEEGIRLFAGGDAAWQSATRSAKRLQREISSWDLSRRHLQHRLQLSMALVRLKSGENMDQELRSLAEATGKLRDGWKALYQDAYTPSFLEVDLGFRFDAEPGIIETVRRWEKEPGSPKSPTGR